MNSFQNRINSWRRLIGSKKGTIKKIKPFTTVNEPDIRNYFSIYGKPLFNYISVWMELHIREFILRVKLNMQFVIDAIKVIFLK